MCAWQKPPALENQFCYTTGIPAELIATRCWLEKFWNGPRAQIFLNIFRGPKNKKKKDVATREEQAIQYKQPKNKVDWLIFIFHKLSRADFCFIVLIFALFNFTYLLLPFAAIGAQIYWITDLFERARGYHL